MRKNISGSYRSRNGFPGPDYCEFRFVDYGRTWAFTLDDFECNLE